MPVTGRLSGETPSARAEVAPGAQRPGPRSAEARHHGAVDHADHVALIGGGIRAAPTAAPTAAPAAALPAAAETAPATPARWLELGAGQGAFTLALADVLGPASSILATDRDASALDVLSRRVRTAFPATRLATQVLDFTGHLPTGPFDGVLAANALHFVHDRQPILAAVRAALVPTGTLLVVEYDADAGNSWVPYPFSFESWRREATAAGFEEPRRTHQVPSRFLGAIYGAVTSPTARP